MTSVEAREISKNACSEVILRWESRIREAALTGLTSIEVKYGLDGGAAAYFQDKGYILKPFVSRYGSGQSDIHGSISW